MQVVDVGTGEVVCFCKWVFFVRGKVGGEGEMKGETRRDYVEEWPEDARVEAIEGVVGEGRRMREKWMGGRDYARMYICSCWLWLGYFVFAIVRYEVGVRRRRYSLVAYSKCLFSIQV